MAPEELELVAGGSMDPWNWDPSWMQSMYSGMQFGAGIPVYAGGYLVGGSYSATEIVVHWTLIHHDYAAWSQQFAPVYMPPPPPSTETYGPEIIVERDRPSKCEANPVTINFIGDWDSGPSTINGTNGADYYLPEHVTKAHLDSVLQHMADISGWNLYDKYMEIFKMYQDTGYQYHIDFKDTAAQSIGYTSGVTGQTVNANPFEAFGNFFYGYALTYAGLSAEEIYAFAAATQGLGGASSAAEAAARALQNLASGNFSDDPNDTPHVEFGMQVMAQYMAATQVGGSVLYSLTINQDSCSGN